MRSLYHPALAGTPPEEGNWNHLGRLFQTRLYQLHPCRRAFAAMDAAGNASLILPGEAEQHDADEAEQPGDDGHRGKGAVGDVAEGVNNRGA